MRAAVVGVGSMGRNHVRVYSELEGVKLVAVADANGELAEHIGLKLNVPGYDDYAQMLEHERPNLVSIVVPTREHLHVARTAMELGCNVLVEKPIASSASEAREMISLAEKHGVVLTIGHIERFNPAIIELKNRLDAGELGRIFKIHARRLGPFPPRIRDVGVVVDLATHDLDIMNYLIGEPVQRVYAETERRIHTAYEDLLLGTLKFSDGALGVLDINWLTPTKIRELIVTGECGTFIANYLTQELRFYKNKMVESSNWNPPTGLPGMDEGDMVQYRIQYQEPLRQELSAFVECVRAGTTPRVTGHDGLAALLLAQTVIASGQQGEAIHLPPDFIRAGASISVDDSASKVLQF